MFNPVDKSARFLLLPDVPVVQVGKRREYFLTNPYEVRWWKGGMQFRIIVPAYFNTDFGTNSPWQDDYLIPGFVLHDFLYFQHTNELPDTNCPITEQPIKSSWYQILHNNEWQNTVSDWSRAECDALMFMAHRDKGAPYWKRFIIHRMVRLFGKEYYNS